ncbi:MAG: putative glycolipid-binding domain-containing protein [Chloroflexota bacterium]
MAPTAPGDPDEAHGSDRLRRRAIGWTKTTPQRGAEWADVEIGEDRLTATGTAIAALPVPYRLGWRLETAARFVTTRLDVRAHGEGWDRRLELRRSPEGQWTATRDRTGAPSFPAPDDDVLATLDDALDCDLGLCPLTNTMPVLRHRLLDGGDPVDFVMAWVSVPDLAVHRSEQRYTFIRRTRTAAVIRYESGSFTSDLRFDADGLVVDYPSLARRL